jgi:hypothetical protein
MEKPVIFFICLSLVFASLTLSGCDEILDTMEKGGSLSVNYINVTVSVRSTINKIVRWTHDGLSMDVTGVPDLEIKIKVDKASGESKIFYGTTDIQGSTDYYTHNLHLYREQPVNMYANLYSEVPDELKNYTISSAYLQITWDEIHAEADFGESWSANYNLEIWAYPPDYPM